MNNALNHHTTHPSPLWDSGAAHIPWPVRWYIAALLVVMLLSLTAHVLVQQQSLLQVQTLVQELAKKHGWQLGSVQLHMLRGALTLRDLDVEQNNLHLQLPYLLLRGHFSENIHDVRLTEIRMQRGRIDWTIPDQLSLYDGATLPLAHIFPEEWQPLFSSARNILLDELTVHIHPAQAQTLLLKRVHIKGEGKAGSRQWFASSQGKLGLLQWRSDSSSSRLDWQDIKADHLLRFLRHGPLAWKGSARIKGHMLWQQQQLSGAMYWQNASHHGRLAWQGQQDSDNKAFAVTVHAVNWPVVTLPFTPPDLRYCVWQEGVINGVTVLLIQPDYWQLQSKEISLSDAISQDPYGQICWKVDQAQLTQVDAQWPQKTIAVEQIQLSGGTWSLPHDLPLEKSSSPWLIHQAKVHYQGITLQDTQQDIALHDFYGEADIHQGTWQLTADSRSDSGAMAQWHIQADNKEVGQKTSALFKFKAEGVGITPATFRHVLPARLTEHATLNAQVQLEITGGVRSQVDDSSIASLGWYGSADVLAHQLSWERDGWQALVDQVIIDHLQFDDLHGIRMDALHIGHWAINAPLTPLTEPNSTAEPWQPFWLADWHIKRATVAAGEWSVGWQNAVWLKLDPFTVAPLQAPLPISIQWTGRLLEGELQAAIEWQPWQAPGGWDMELSLHHALPFAVNTWLLQSDLPDFIRGRLDLDFHLVSNVKDHYSYHGKLGATLAHASMAQGVHQSDSFVRLAGVAPRSLLKRLADNEQFTLNIPFQGDWQSTPFTWGGLGAATLHTIKQRYDDHPPTRTLRHDHKGLAYIRLHQDDGLWPNERARIKTVIQTLKQSPLLVLELVPQLGRHALDASFISKTRKTQQLIEDYMRERHISLNRIIPLWPQKSHKAGGEAGIRLQMYTPQTVAE
ncbi:MAG: hypothetical protein Q9M09_00535 [Mariprofundaceae bacterium]|nr:hypothetical protein [Mariprofundaceae bacterium]